ncbi:MAG: hypothetical protein QOF51_3807 [Chloroflexota bacterium]|jgi:hypothetical protein|nr:hypothetical protein [Chloroflexota bacterium]
MADPGQYSDSLRVIGQFLDDHGGSDIEIIDHGIYYAVSWQPEDAIRHRSCRAFELRELMAEARRHRTVWADPERLGITLGETLCALGAECDHSGVELLTVRQTEDGFRVTVFSGRVHSTCIFSDSDVVMLMEEQQARLQDCPTLVLAGV